MKTYFPFEREDGTRDMVAAEDIEAYRRSFPNAQQFKAFELPGGRGRTMVRQSDWDAFAGAEPDAKEYYFAETGAGERFEVAKDDFRAFLDSENPATSGTPVRDALAGAGEAALAGPRFAWGAAKGIAGAAAAPVAAIEGNAARANRAEAKDLRERADELDGGAADPKKLREAVRFKSDPRLYRTLTPEQREEVDRLAGIARHANPTPENREKAAALREEAARKEARAASQEGVKAALTPARGESRAERAGQTVGSFAAVPLEMAATGPVAGAALLGAEGAEAAASNLEAQGMDPRAAARRGTAVGAAETLPWLVPGAAPARTLAGRVARPAAEMAAKTVAGQELGRAATPAESRPDRDWGETALAAGGAALAGGILGAAGAIAEGRAQRRADAAQAARTVSVEVPGVRGPNGEAVYYNLAAARERPGEVVLQAAEMARRAREPDMAARKADADAMREAVEPGPRAIPERGEPPAPPPIDVEGRVVAVDVGNRGRVVEGAPEAPALPPGEGTPPTVGGRPRVLVTPFEGPRASAGGAIALPDPALTPEQAALPTTPEQLDAARAAALAQRPLRERMSDTSLAAYQAEHPTPALEAIGADNFRALARKFKGDFRDVTSDPFDVLEVAQQAGRPDLAQDQQGAAKLLQMAADELAGYQDWKGRGAPTLEQESYGGAEIAANRAEQAEARERHAARLAAETEPAPPPEEQRALAAGADAAAEDAFIAEMERGELEAPLVRNGKTPQRRGAMERALEGETPEEAGRREAREIGEQNETERLAESAKAENWGDLTRPVATVGNGTPKFSVAEGDKAGAVMKQVYPLAEANVNEQPNRITDLPNGLLGMRVDGVDYSLPWSGLFHSFPRRSKTNAPAVAQIGDIMNASVPVPVAKGNKTFRIASVNFGEPSFALLVFDKANKLTDFKLYSINVKTGPENRLVSSSSGTRLTETTLAQVVRAWQEVFLPDQNGHAADKARMAVRNAFPMDSEARKKFHSENRGVNIGARIGNDIVFLGEDARRVGKILGIEVVGKANSKKDNAMVRFPAEDLDANLETLIKAGQKVALWEDGRPVETSVAPVTADEVWINGEKTTRDKLTPRGAALLEKAQSLVGRTFRHDNGDGKAFTLEVLGITPKGNVKVRQRWTDENGKPIPELDRDFVQFMSWTEDFGGKDFPEVKPVEPAQDAAALQAAFDQAYNSWAMAEQIVEGREMRGEDTTEAKARAAALYEQMSAAQRALAAAKQPAKSGGKGGGFADADGREPSMLDRAAAGEPIAAEEASRASRPVRGSSGSVMADLGAADGEGARSKRSREDAELVTAALEALRRNWDGAGNVDELRDFASKLEARSLYGSAAKLKRAAGDPAPRPGLSTEGAHAIWPTQEPGVSRVALHELAELALSLGAGRAPGVAQRLRGLQGRALGYYMPLGRGSIMLKANLFQLVDKEERARIRAEILGSGGDEKDVRAAIAERVRENMMDDAPKAAQVLAHEIGHWIDDLPELGMLRGRGNVLGHIASLKHFLAKTIFLDPKKAREWGADEEAPGLDPKEREKIAREALKGVKRKDFASDEDFKAAQKRARREAIENALAERGLAEYPQVRGELDDLIAWYRQSDHAPDYYQQPWEMFAEAFSAWLYYPRTAAAKAPTFVKLLEAWGPKKGEAWERVRAIQRREPAFDGVAGSVGGGFLERFKERMRAATLAHYKLAGYRVPDLAQGGGRAAWQDWIGSALTTFWGELRWVDHAARMLEKERTGAVREGGWGTPEGAAALGSVHEYTAASAMAEAELRRFQTEVVPMLEQGGATLTDLDVYATLYRVSKEVLGAESQGGRANLANPNGLTPASARAMLEKWRREDPATFDTVKRAQELFARIRRETVLPFARKNAGIAEAAMEEMLDNDAYARFMALFAPRAARAPAARGEMRAGTGIRHQKTGFLAQNISPILATLMGDGQIYFDSALNGARRDAVRLLAAAFPEAVRVTPMRWDPEARALVPNQTNGGGWRTVVFRELDDKGQSRVVGYDLRDWAAFGLRGVEKAAPGPGRRFLRVLDDLGRMNARAVTSLSWGFSLLNPFRDVSGMRRNLPAGPDAGAGQRWIGSLGASVRAFLNGAGRAREKGEPNAALDEALAAGAMPGGTFDHRAFSHRAADALQRLFLAGADERAALAAADDVVRALNLDPKLVGAQEKFWRTIGGAIEKVWGALPRRLGRMETNVKAQAWAEVRRAHPDWDPRRAAEFVARYTGTPSPQAPAAIAQIPGFRLVSLFYTMTTRGLGDQIFGAARQQPGIMGRRLFSHIALRQLLNNSWWMLVGTGAAAAAGTGGLVGWLRRQAAPADGDDEDESYYKRGLAGTADALEWFARAQRAASPFDKQQGYLLPLFTVDEKTGKYAFLKIPYDQSFYPIDALADYAASELTGMRNFTASAMSDTVSGGALPSAGPGLRQLDVWLAGEDLGQGGRSIHRNEDRGLAEHVWDHLATSWDIWTGRGWGVLPARGNVLGAMLDDRKTDLEKFLSVPGIVNTLRPFLRVSNQGDAETARMVRSWAAENEREARRAATAIVRDEEPEAEDLNTLETYTADPQGMIERAMQRDWEERNMTPTERALEAIPRRMRDDARERFGLP